MSHVARLERFDEVPVELTVSSSKILACGALQLKDAKGEEIGVYAEGSWAALVSIENERYAKGEA
jgi:hypothetical protein